MKKPSAPKLKKPNVQAPGFLGDLLRDLRDRRLLVPAIALVAGLIAVPTLLARTSEPAPPPAPPAAAAEASPASAAVLAEQEVGVRDYRKRLEQLKSKNPFEQQFPLPDVSESDDLDVSDPGLSTGADTSTSTGATVDTSGSTSSADTSTTSTAPSSSPGSSGDASPAPKPPEIKPVYFAHEIDVLVGPVGATVERDGVDQLSLLPSKNKPVVAFLGITQDGKDAVFAVSRDVASVAGGECVPSDSNCAYVVLGEGDDATFEYTPDGVTYRLKLKKIRAVKLKDGASSALP